MCEVRGKDLIFTSFYLMELSFALPCHHHKILVRPELKQALARARARAQEKLTYFSNSLKSVSICINLTQMKFYLKTTPPVLVYVRV